MRVSIIVPTYNHLSDCLKPCLESIIKYTDLEKGDIEVVVVANGCKDGTEDYVTSLGPAFKLISTPDPLGYTRATNLGIRSASGEYVVLLNNDTTILESPKNLWLQMLIDPFEDPKTGVTGPMKALCIVTGLPFIIFFCACIKRESFFKYGLLDEGFNPGYGEDVEYCVRMERAGYKTVQVPIENSKLKTPEFMVGTFPIYHGGESTFGQLENCAELFDRSKQKLRDMFGSSILKLNIGAGDQKLEGYKSVDLYAANADYKLDARRLTSIQDESVDEILTVHMLEHISPYEVYSLLKEWRRVLKPNGKLVIEVPDMQAMCKEFTSGNLGTRYHMLNCIYGTGDWGKPSYTPHVWGWEYEMLLIHLFKSGFRHIERKPAQFPHMSPNLRVEAIKSDQEEVPGFFSEYNANVYRRLLSQVPEQGNIAELGVWCGRSMCWNADIIREKKLQVAAVDTFKGTENENSPLQEEAAKSNIAEQFLRNVTSFGIAENVSVHVNTTEAASKEFQDESLDLVFIDADHSYEAVKKDMDNWWPKLKKGGIMAGHDYAPYAYEGVVRAVNERFGSLVSDESDVWWVQKKHGKVFDCCIVHDELDLLDIRFAELDSVVDRFIVVEGDVTFSGKPKPFYFAENLKRFEKYLHKITHFTCTLPRSHDPWIMEHSQRNMIGNALAQTCQPDDIVIISDADEIVSAKAVASYDPKMGLAYPEMRLFYYFTNCEGEPWDQARIFPYRLMTNKNASDMRYTPAKRLANGGWHFSYLGGVDAIIRKIESWTHQEYNRPEFKDREKIVDAMMNGKDIFGRSQRFKFVDALKGMPKSLQQSISTFREKGLVR